MLKSDKSSFVFYFCLFWILLNVISASKGRSPARMTRIPCPIPDSIPNGSYKIRKNNMLRRISCMPGYELQGDRTIECVNGRWKGERAICTKPGCDTDIPYREHGHILIERDIRMILFCIDAYILAGNQFAYCNGTHWDRELGNCRELSFNVEHECDFETVEICGWTHEESIGTQWKRVMAANIYTSYHTGPRHDHTTMSESGGYYMLMETIESAAQPALLLSPVYERDLSLKTACCFRFYYFMYGIGVGDLKVFVRPITKSLENVLSHDELLRFHKSGNQNNSWNEAHFTISELEEDFQIVFVAIAGHNHLSDIAIDDVKLMTGEDCQALDKPNDDFDDPADENVKKVDVLVDTQSCRGRCQEETGAGYVRRLGQLYGRCNCHAECEEDETCCPDFQSICLNEMFDQSPQSNQDTTFYTQSTTNKLSETTENTIPPTTREAMTTTTTTTTVRTTPTSTTTTHKPTTTTPRTTSTTRKMTTTKKTSTTTTSTTSTTSTTPKSTTTTTTTPRPIMPKMTTSTTKTPTKATTATKTPTKTTKTTTTTTINPTKKVIYFWNRTTTIQPTINSRILSTTTSLRSTSTTTTTLKPTIKKIYPFERPTGRRSKSQKHEIVSWNIDNSSKELKSSAKRILFGTLILLLIAILVSTVYYNYKDGFKKLICGERFSSGDVETTSIRARFLAKTNQLTAGSKIIGIKSRLSNRSNGDLNCLVDEDNDFDNDGCLHVNNPSPIDTTNFQKDSLSTNL